MAKNICIARIRQFIICWGIENRCKAPVQAFPLIGLFLGVSFSWPVG